MVQVAPDPYLYLQSALLYTNSDGERRIRVHTMCVPVTQNFSELVSSVDEPAVAILLGQQAIELVSRYITQIYLLLSWASMQYATPLWYYRYHQYYQYGMGSSV